MRSFLPEIHQIEVQLGGRMHSGCWYILLGSVVINFHGHTRSLPASPQPSPEELTSAFKDLVAVHYVEFESIPADWPQNIREAAHRYINFDEDESALDELIEAFGHPIRGNTAFRQIGWLCLSGLDVVVPFWEQFCDGNDPKDVYSEMKRWIEDSNHFVRWERAVTPAKAFRNGVPIVDHDACRVEPIAEAVAATASFLKTADSKFAIQAVLLAGAAHDEGCRPDDSFSSFEERVVKSLLPSALLFRSPL